MDFQLGGQDSSEILRPHQGIIDVGKPPAPSAATNDEDVDEQVHKKKHRQLFLGAQHRMNKKKLYRLLPIHFTFQYNAEKNQREKKFAHLIS